MVMKLRYGQVAGCFEGVVESDSMKARDIVYSQTTNILRSTVLCDITNTSALSYISFALAQLIVLFCSFFVGAVDTAGYLTSGWLIDELKQDVARSGREII
jgi:hypothetical protein